VREAQERHLARIVDQRGRAAVADDAVRLDRRIVAVAHHCQSRSKVTNEVEKKNVGPA
jgi:hypothetical protein